MELKKLLFDIIDLLDAYSDQDGNGTSPSLDGFIRFAHDNSPDDNEQDKNVRIAQNISFLHRYSKQYIKKALKGTSLQTVSEYSYLAALYSKESLTKTELNNINVTEKTSGNEIMRRLLKEKLIGERRDREDRRRMRVFITEKGRAELDLLFPQLNRTAELLSGVLTDYEKRTLLQVTDKLCAFHKAIFLNQKEEEIDNLLPMLNRPLP